jgi:hypothetical protein
MRAPTQLHNYNQAVFQTKEKPLVLFLKAVIISRVLIYENKSLQKHLQSGNK